MGTDVRFGLKLRTDHIQKKLQHTSKLLLSRYVHNVTDFDVLRQRCKAARIHIYNKFGSKTVMQITP